MEQSQKTPARNTYCYVMLNTVTIAKILFENKMLYIINLEGIMHFLNVKFIISEISDRVKPPADRVNLRC